MRFRIASTPVKNSFSRPKRCPRRTLQNFPIAHVLLYHVTLNWNSIPISTCAKTTNSMQSAATKRSFIAKSSPESSIAYSICMGTSTQKMARKYLTATKGLMIRKKQQISRFVCPSWKCVFWGEKISRTQLRLKGSYKIYWQRRSYSPATNPSRAVPSSQVQGLWAAQS